MEIILSTGESIEINLEEALPNSQAEAVKWLEAFKETTGTNRKRRRTVEKRCGTCHYFRKLNDPKVFAEDEGQCWSPWQERDTRGAGQFCEDWAAREPERLDMPPSGRRKKREPYAWKPEGGTGHGWLRFRRANRWTY